MTLRSLTIIRMLYVSANTKELVWIKAQIFSVMNIRGPLNVNRLSKGEKSWRGTAL